MADEKDMVTVTLRRSVGLRGAGDSAGGTLYGPGRVKVPRELAKSLGLKAERASARAAASSGGETDADPYKGFKLADFQAEAERRELEVTRTDGGDGDLRIEDYRAALESADKK